MGCSHSSAAKKHLAIATHPSQRCFDWQRAEDTDSLRVVEKQAVRESQRSGQPLKQYRPAEPHPLLRCDCTSAASDSFSTLIYEHQHLQRR